MIMKHNQFRRYCSGYDLTKTTYDPQELETFIRKGGNAKTIRIDAFQNESSILVIADADPACLIGDHPVTHCSGQC